MRYDNSLTGTVLIGTGLPEPESGYRVPVEPTKSGRPRRKRPTTTRVRMIPVDPARLVNCAILTPEEHQEYAPPRCKADIVMDAFQRAVERNEPPTLPVFLDALDDKLGLGRSIDLMIWLRGWREGQA